MTKDFLKPLKWTSERWAQRRVKHNGRYYYFLGDNLKLDLSEDLYVRDDYKK